MRRTFSPHRVPIIPAPGANCKCHPRTGWQLTAVIPGPGGKLQPSSPDRVASYSSRPRTGWQVTAVIPGAGGRVQQSFPERVASCSSHPRSGWQVTAVIPGPGSKLQCAFLRPEGSKDTFPRSFPEHECSIPRLLTYHVRISLCVCSQHGSGEGVSRESDPKLRLASLTCVCDKSKCHHPLYCLDVS